MKVKIKPINIIFDGPPGAVAGRFVEVENDARHGMRIGGWRDMGDGMWALRITEVELVDGLYDVRAKAPRPHSPYRPKL